MTELTKREQDVCDLLIEGYSNKEIARMLGDLSPRTVEDHRATIFKKSDVRNLVELILKVHKLGKFSIQPERGLSNEQTEEYVEA